MNFCSLGTLFLDSLDLWLAQAGKSIGKYMVRTLQSSSTPGLSPWFGIFESQWDKLFPGEELGRSAGGSCHCERYLVSKTGFVCKGTKQGEQPPVSVDGFCTSLNIDFPVCKGSSLSVRSHRAERRWQTPGMSWVHCLPFLECHAKTSLLFIPLFTSGMVYADSVFCTFGSQEFQTRYFCCFSWWKMGMVSTCQFFP